MDHSLDAQRDALALLQRAALAWWEEHRPADWTLRAHLDSPTVNTHGPVENELAVRVATCVEIGSL